MQQQKNLPRILSIGTAVPPYQVSQQEHCNILLESNGLAREEKILLRSIYRFSGISQRHSVIAEFGKAYSEDNLIFHPAADHPQANISERLKIYAAHGALLMEDACRRCFEGISPDIASKITHLITFSCTGLSAPGPELHLISSLNLRDDTERLGINFMGCYAAITALKTASHIAQSDPEAVVLIAGAELCTLHYHRQQSTDELIGNAIFGDGAAAAVITCNKDIPSQDSVTLKSFYSKVIPDGSSAMSWQISETAFRLRLSPEVPEFILAAMSDIFKAAVNKAGLTANDIRNYALHPGGIKILEACEEALGITRMETAVSREVLHNYGNMSSVTILFVLKNLLKQRPEGNIFSCAFGPGLTVESMILER